MGWQPTSAYSECANLRLVWVPAPELTDGGYHELAYTGLDGWCAESGGLIDPTHWMPLPDPPETTATPTEGVNKDSGVRHGGGA